MLYASKSKTVIISLIFVFKRKCVQKKKLLKMCHRFSFPQSRQWMGTHEYLPLHKNLCVFFERARTLYVSFINTWMNSAKRIRRDVFIIKRFVHLFQFSFLLTTHWLFKTSIYTVSWLWSASAKNKTPHGKIMEYIIYVVFSSNVLNYLW